MTSEQISGPPAQPWGSLLSARATVCHSRHTHAEVRHASGMPRAPAGTGSRVLCPTKAMATGGPPRCSPSRLARGATPTVVMRSRSPD
jgi:hypothetical protein